MTVAEINKLIQELPSEERGKVSDSYHTIDELYTFRKVYNAALFNEWASRTQMATTRSHKAGDYGATFEDTIVFNPKYDVHKSWRHHDRELCFGGEWFIVVAVLPTGQISNHYHKDDWDLFKIPEVEKAKYPFDNHTSQDCLDCLKQL